MERAVFLDRDGTLIAEKNYLSRPEEVEFLPGTGPALGRLAAAGYKLILVTNQSGIGRGYFTLADAGRVHAHLQQELARHGAALAKIYLAPEAPGQPSRGRKPSPQFLYDARDEFGLDLSASYMIGDKLIDLECGWNAGTRRSILVRTGYGAEVERQNPAPLTRAVVTDDVAGAVAWILHQA